MDYTMEELIPVVAGLAGKFTSKESTSITYERANQLMEAVISVSYTHLTLPTICSV